MIDCRYPVNEGGICIKRSAIFMLMLSIAVLLFSSVPGYAAETQETQDANTLVLAVKEFSYHLEVGISQKKYNDLFSDVYVKYRVFTDKYPQSPILPQLGKVMQVYLDAKEVWVRPGGVEGYVNDDMVGYLRKAYPGIEKEVSRDFLGQWRDKISVVDALVRRNKANLAQLSQAYKDNYEPKPASAPVQAAPAPTSTPTPPADNGSNK